MASRSVVVYLAFENQLKNFGPLIQYLLDERASDFRVTVVIPQWLTEQNTRAVARNNPTEETLRSLWDRRIDVCEMSHPDVLLDMARSGAIEVFLASRGRLEGLPDPYAAAVRAESLKRGTTWVALPEGFSLDFMVFTDLSMMLERWDVWCLTGPRSLRYVEQRLKHVSSEVAKEVRSRLAVVGFPQFDGLDRLKDSVTLRSKYGLPTDKPIVFVATAPLFYPLASSTLMARGLVKRFRRESDWSIRGVLARGLSCRYPRLTTYTEHLSALREFADRNDACLVGKTRPKHQDPEYVSDYLDYLISDRSFFPFTTDELLKVSSLYFGFYSTTAMEALAANVYSVTSLFLPPSTVETVKAKLWAEYFFFGNNGHWCTPGVSELIDGSSSTGKSAVKKFAQAPLSAYQADPERMLTLRKDLFSYFGCSSKIIADSLG